MAQIKKVDTEISRWEIKPLKGKKLFKFVAATVDEAMSVDLPDTDESTDDSDSEAEVTDNASANAGRNTAPDRTSANTNINSDQISQREVRFMLAQPLSMDVLFGSDSGNSLDVQEELAAMLNTLKVKIIVFIDGYSNLKSTLLSAITSLQQFQWSLDGHQLLNKQ